MIVLEFLSRSTRQMAGWLAAMSATMAGTITGLVWDAGPLAAQGAQGYCASELSDTVVYVSTIFDTKLNPKVPIASQSIARVAHAAGGRSGVADGRRAGARRTRRRGACNAAALEFKAAPTAMPMSTRRP